MQQTIQHFTALQHTSNLYNTLQAKYKTLQPTPNLYNILQAKYITTYRTAKQNTIHYNIQPSLIKYYKNVTILQHILQALAAVQHAKNHTVLQHNTKFYNVRENFTTLQQASKLYNILQTVQNFTLFLNTLQHIIS